MSQLRELRLRPFWGGFKGYNLVSERVPLPSSRAMGPGDEAWLGTVIATMKAMRWGS